MPESAMNDLKRWLDKDGEETLRKIGIRKGQTILDFGCGSGYYAIPAARIVGEDGRVCTLDMDRGALDELMRRARSEGLRNVTRIDTRGEVEIGLEDESIDVVLLYDIFWYFPLTDNRLPKLLDEVYKVSKPDASISVYPKHIDSKRLMDKIEKAGFRLNNEYCGMLIHDGRLEKGQVLNFVKIGYRKRKCVMGP